MDASDQLELALRLILAAALGAIVGFEREFRGYPAGIRTMALVCLGATLFTDVSRVMGGDDRVAAAVVTGIGFIGAGMIFREGATVKGMTTAATIWAMAAIGLALGNELYLVALVGTAVAVGLLELRIVTKRLDEYLQRRPREADHEDETADRD
ncbi:MAG: MgtC/SapB family protein [Dehalococcoidia bacterium]